MVTLSTNQARESYELALRYAERCHAFWVEVSTPYQGHSPMLLEAWREKEEANRVLFICRAIWERSGKP